MLLIADISPLISLIVLNRLSLLDQLFDEYSIKASVWEEITAHKELTKYISSLQTLSEHISSFSFPNSIERGDENLVKFYMESNADFLLVDDKRTWIDAKMENILCIGTLGLLYIGYKKGLIKELRTDFNKLADNKRFYSKEILNFFLQRAGEKLI